MESCGHGFMKRRGRPGLFAVLVFTKQARLAEAKQPKFCEEPRKDGPKYKERKAAKSLVLKENRGASARPPRGTSGQLRPL
jgi:hypothetical protein